MGTYELKLGDGTVARWQGRDGVDAAVRYADAHPGVTVLAWRTPRVQLRVGVLTGAATPAAPG